MKISFAHLYSTTYSPNKNKLMTKKINLYVPNKIAEVLEKGTNS